MCSDIAISVRKISKAYQVYDRPLTRLKHIFLGSTGVSDDDFWALRDINFDILKGETVGIIGRNGCGKSTLLQIICGTVTPTDGSITKHGRVSALLELGSGFNMEFTGRENVYLNGSILGFSYAEMEERFERIAAFANIGHFIDSPVKHYSSGMFARLAFSVAIHVDPQILIVDEILAVGDALFQKKCLQKFYELRESGCTILFVSHDAYQVKSVCTRALYLKEGEQILFGNAAEVVDQYMIDMEAAERDSQLIEEKKPQLIDVPITIDERTSLVNITSVLLMNESGDMIEQVKSGQTISVKFSYRIPDISVLPKVNFVINLYRHDDLYICGTTTKMDGILSSKSKTSGEVIITFPKIRLLAGQYKWRVAINDEEGLGILAEAVPVCPFKVVDSFEAVGLINLERHWCIDGIEYS